MPKPETIAKLPAGALFALALVVGLPLGGGAAWLTAGRSPAGTDAKSLKAGRNAGPASIVSAPGGEVSKLGKGANPTSAFSRLVKQLIEGQRQRYAAEAAALPQEQRLARILEIAKEGSEDFFSTDAEKMLDQGLHLNAFIQPEDIPRLLEILKKGNTGLSQSQTYSLQQAVYNAAAKGDPKEILALMNGAEDEVVLGVQTALLDKKAAEDPFLAIEMLNTEDFELLNQSYQARNVFAKAAAVDPARAFALAQKAGGGYEGRKRAMGSVLMAMAMKDGLDKALKMSESIQAEGLRSGTQSEFLAEMSQAQGNMRAQVLDYLKDPEKLTPSARSSTVQNVLEYWTWSDPSAAFDWGLAHGKEYGLGDELKGTLGSAIDRLCEQDPAKGFDKVLSLPAEQRQDYLGNAISAMAKQDTEKAKAALEKLTTKEQEAARPKFIAGWAQRNPAEAAAYVDTLGAAPDRGQLVSELLDSWVDLDQRGASEWLAAQPADATRDDGVRKLVQKIERQDPEAAALWALQITDTKQRSNSLDRTLGTWANKDPNAVRGFIQAQSSTLGPEETTRRLGMVDAVAKKK